MRGYHQAVSLCREYGGYLPHTFLGSEPGNARTGDAWHWLANTPVGENCLAIRPAHSRAGAAYFPCQANLSIACQQHTHHPPPTVIRRGRWGGRDSHANNPYIQVALGLLGKK